MKSRKKNSTSKRTKSKTRTAKTIYKTERGKRVDKVKPSKKSAKENPAQKKSASTMSIAKRKRTSVNTEKDIQREIRNKNRIDSARLSSRQSGDFQGLSRAQQADSESVDELVEEGNLFEASAVAGVERADEAD